MDRSRAQGELEIAGLRDLDLESLTGILRRAGILTIGRVANVEVLLAKTLKVSKVARLRIEYEPQESTTTAPRTLFLKLAKRSDEENVFDPRSEATFYQTVGEAMTGPPIIRCFHVGESNATESPYLLMEDLTESHFQPASPEAPSVECSELAVRCLAEFHAVWWEHPRLGNGVGTYFDEAWLAGFVKDLGESFKRFIRAVDLTESRRRVYDRVLAASPKIWGRLTDHPGLTVTNGDTHWWNFMYPKDPSVDQVRLFDWQLWHLDLGARDLAFLVSLGGFAEPRPEIEGRLLELYFSTLVENGIRDYSWETFVNDYRLSAIRNLNIPVIYHAQGREEEEWRPLLERAFDAFDILQCSDLI